MSDEEYEDEAVKAFEIDWNKTPRWAKWAGQCSDGVVALYQNKPRIIDFGEYWHYVNNGGRYCFAGETEVVSKDFSLTMNPRYQH